MVFCFYICMEGCVQNIGYYNKVGVSNTYLNFVGNDNTKFDTVYDPFLSDIKLDCVEFSSANPEIEEKYDDILNKQGLVGKVWDFAKNTFGSKMGSKAVSKKIELYKQGLISEDEIVDLVNKYAKGQQKALDFVADWGATVIGAGAFALAVPLGAGVPLALGCAALGGALFKTGTKKLDAYSAGREYKTAPYDIATGAISGLLSPIVNGIGNAAVKTVAGKLGLQNVTKGVGSLIYRDFGDAIKYFALFPKQELQGAVAKRLAAWGAGKAVRGVAKFGGALALREYVFAVFSQDAITKTALMQSPFVRILANQGILDEIEEIKGKEIDFSNDMYACFNPQSGQFQMQA